MSVPRFKTRTSGSKCDAITNLPPSLHVVAGVFLILFFNPLFFFQFSSLLLSFFIFSCSFFFLFLTVLSQIYFPSLFLIFRFPFLFVHFLFSLFSCNVQTFSNFVFMKEWTFNKVCKHFFKLDERFLNRYLF